MLSIPTLASILVAFISADDIAFVREINGLRQVCLASADDGTVRELGTGPWDGAPVWSPDGTRIAYVTHQGEAGCVISVIAADGSGKQVTSAVPTISGLPSWSPDSTRIAYGVGESAERRIAVFDVTAKTEAFWGKASVPLAQPTWKSGSELVAVGFTETEGGQTTDLFLVEATEASVVVQTRGNGTYVEHSPSVHLPTAVLAYESNDGGDREIFVDLPRRGVVDVSNHRAADWNPVWSPDGQWIAFESFRGGVRGIYRASPQRTNVYPVATGDAQCWWPTWSPDSKSLAYISIAAGKPTLHVCRADGSGHRAVTTHDAADLAPAWKPSK